MLWLFSGVFVLGLVGLVVWLARRDARHELEKSIVKELEGRLEDALEVHRKVDELSDADVTSSLRAYRRGNDSMPGAPPSTPS